MAFQEKSGVRNDGGALVAFIRPENQKLNSSHELRREIYNADWQYYSSEAYEELAVWAPYIRQKGLYEYTRLLYNPFRRLVDFYAGHVYPGRLSEDGNDFDDGRVCADPVLR